MRAHRKITPYDKPPAPSALELQFTEKSLGRVDSSEITLEDARRVSLTTTYRETIHPYNPRVNPSSYVV